MTTEEQFRRESRRRGYRDHIALMVFADWLQEQGEDAVADGYRAVSICRITPSDRGGIWDLSQYARTYAPLIQNGVSPRTNRYIRAMVDHEWFLAATGVDAWDGNLWHHIYPNTWEAWRALAKGFPSLNPEKRAAILAHGTEAWFPQPVPPPIPRLASPVPPPPNEE